MKWRFIILTIGALALFLVSCDGTDTREIRRLVSDPAVSNEALATTEFHPSFPVIQQGFNHDVKPWVGQETPGPSGWCGDLNKADRRETAGVTPSAGRGYATVEHGTCNDFFTNEVFGGLSGTITSAPASLNPDLLSTTWPSSGFVQQLDIYLDSGDRAGTDASTYVNANGLLYGLDGDFVPKVDDVVFHYANSLCVLSDDGTCFPSAGGPPEFHYFTVAVTKDGGNLLVSRYEVHKAGWYTFRHVFGSRDDGTLTVDFELLRRGRVLFTESISSTYLSDRPTSTFNVSDLGSGYIWFPSIADGLELPIDEHKLHEGRGGSRGRR